MRLGIFGGSFDPVHLGHLLLADCCAKQANLDEVWFVPAANQPLKPAGPRASGAHRLSMLELATADRSEFVSSPVELDRGGVSYTVDTLAIIHANRPDATLFFLMGADSLADLPGWHRPADICALATPLVVRRAGSSPLDFDPLRSLVGESRVGAIQQTVIEMPPTPISSSEIRTLITRDGSWQHLVPLAVADYIETHRLYETED
ncbi:MAG: nicotinate (nicotinamide) nucleotide adenylyltransferase [Planctomycetota bacterium]